METDHPKNSQEPSCGCCGESAEPRRGFLVKLVTVLLGTAALAAPAVVGLVAFFSPLRRKKQDGEFCRITTLDALPADGTPRMFPVIADRKDAWTLYKDVSIGSIFLRRIGSKKVLALSVICPHAGCYIGFDATAEDFLCPCHLAHFDLDGKRTDEHSKSPRNMDTLDGVEIRNGNEIWVKFEKFRTGIAKKVAEA